MKLNIHSSDPKLFWLVVLILLFTISGSVSDLAPKKLSLSFDESFIIGKNTGADAKYFLASPYQIRTDNRQDIYIAEGQQRSRGKINSYSIGLVQMSDGKVLHFSGQRMQNQNSLKTMVEVFNPRGNLVRTGYFDEIAINENLGYFSSNDPAIWMDEKDGFYFIDYDDVPVVRVGKIEGL